MPQARRSSDVAEGFGEQTVIFGLPGVVLLLLAGVLFRYQGTSGALSPLAILLTLIGLVLIGVALRNAFAIRGVKGHDFACPYCQAKNRLTETPDDDFLCTSCHRRIPVRDGHILPVEQVRCGHCNALNYYSDKTEVLLCESCNHDIPLAQADELAPRRTSVFAVTEDSATYELVLVAAGPKTEEMIATLQHMLALNRNQVKGILDTLPQTLLTGIPRMKADLLKAQISASGGEADIRAMPS